MFQHLTAEFLSTALMIIFGVGVHCDEVLKNTKYRGSGHIFAITTWGFGITIALFMFDGVCMNPAMVLAQCILGMIPWSCFVPYSLAELLGAFVASLIIYIMYADQFKASENEVDPIAVRNIFSTNPIIRNLPRNFFVELFATFIFISATLMIATKYKSMLPIGVGLLVWAIGMGLGGPTGFAMNQARDLGPRLAFQVLPIKNKANNDWQYGLLISGLAPFVGAAVSAMFVHLYFGI
ncbi:D/L-lactic acid transporter LarD [Clostridium sp.]|uniref:D/L-lactic acid transporter LarD n=1 Tax=Clostridium sp. TaxID=1506 RepID=UPI00290F8990|nr:D/L-lactic acid transporter LarD [Clostridium sp.]MDU4480167.1 D/L-lactic acid transporter LarD [Clostridium sp.]